ncbi:Intradiol ring-cleavage dioxygenase [Aspergillus crustosus]
MHFYGIITLTAAMLALAHPGEKHDPAVLKREFRARDLHAIKARNALDSCSSSDEALQLNQRNVARRAQTIRDMRKGRGITANPQKWRRDLAALEEREAIDHNKTGILNYAPDTPEEEIFDGNTSAILAPTITNGPYYPIPGAFVDICNANATGIYSVVATGNVAADEWDSTYLRSIQETNEDGIVIFQTIFPGHYDGRATHTHLLTHLNATVNRKNGTLEVGTGSVAHIGQLFWNEVLCSAVEELSPYNTNTQAITTNADNMWSIEQANDEYDPFPEYVYLGNGLDDGLFAWIQIGINASADYTDNSYYSIAAYYDEDGGHQNTDSSAFGGGGGGGSAPSGAVPSGVIPSGTAAPSV